VFAEYLFRSQNSFNLVNQGVRMSFIKISSFVLSTVISASAMAQAVTEGAKLTGVSSPAAGISEIHEMKMEKDIMKMAAVPSLNVPAGGAVELKPGGYHVMLMDLKAPLADKATVPITLTFENAKGVKSQVELQVPVRAMNAKMDHKH
jgi:copper(I)-binding protein